MKALLAKIVVTLLSMGLAFEVQATSIAVVMSSDAAAYQEALEGFRETTRHQIVGVQTLKRIQRLGATSENGSVLISSLTRFVTGTSALQAMAGL